MRADDLRLHRLCRVAALIVVGVGAYLRLRNAWTDLETLSRTTLSDDSFYDFGIARHISLGHPPSIDGVHPTNGYHPLWVALMSIVYRIAGRGDLVRPIHLALTLGAVLDVASAFVIDRIGGKLRSSAPTRLLVLVLFSFNAYAVVNATSGLETPLALLSLLLLFDASVPPVEGRLASPLGFGLLGGLAILSRTDLALVFAVLALRRALVDARDTHEWKTRVPIAARRTAITFAGALLVVTPWLLYSWRTTGAVVQSSAIALPLIHARIPQLWGLEHEGFGLHVRRVGGAMEEAVALVVRFLGVGRSATIFLLGAMTAVLVVARGRRRAFLFGRLGRLAWPVCALLFLGLLHVGARLVFRPWYTAPFIACFVLVTGVFVDDLLRRAPRAEVVTGLVVVAFTLCLGREGALLKKIGLYSATPYHAMATDLHEGHTDCGAMAYFTVDHVTNLDGITNQGAFEAMRDHRLLEYVRHEGFERLYVNTHLQSEVYFGPRYREQLRSHEDDGPRALRLVHDDAEKDALILLDRHTVMLGSTEGRELWSDGWQWHDAPQPNDWANSVGGASEIVLTLPSARGAAPSVELELRAAVVDARGVQPVDVYLDGALALSVDVTKTPMFVTLPMGNARPGRNRIRLVYKAPVLDRLVTRFGWWRDPTGLQLRAVEAGRIRFVRADDRRLPPVGPKLGEPEGDRILTSGFLPVERDADPPATWAIGPRADVTFWDAGAAGARTLRIEAGPPPASGDLVGQTMTIEIDGRAVGAIELLPGPVASHDLIVPEGIVRAGENHLVLRFARTAHDGGFDRAAYVRTIELR
jgi:hypothetical protein